MLFKQNDFVVYGAEGVCRIIDIAKRRFYHTEREYYILVPVHKEASTIYVPVGNKKLEAKMHWILSPGEIYQLIDSMPEQDDIWIENETQRKNAYQEILRNGKHTELIALIRTIYRHQEERKAEGKKLHQCDANFFAAAQKMLHDEISVALDIQVEEVLPLILRQLEPRIRMEEEKKREEEAIKQ